MVRDSIQRRIKNLENNKFSEELDDFTKALRIGNGIKPVKIRTVQGYVDVLIQLQKLTPKKNLIDLNKKDLINYFDSREDRNLAKVSINLHKISI